MNNGSNNGGFNAPAPGFGGPPASPGFGGPPPSPYGAPPPGGGGYMGGTPPKNTLAFVGLGTGIGSLVCPMCVCVPCLGYLFIALMPVLAIAGIVCGGLGVKNSNSVQGLGKGAGIAGIVTGILGLVLFGTLIVAYIVLGAAYFAELQQQSMPR